MPKGPPQIRGVEPFMKEIGTYLMERDIKVHVPYTIISNDGETHTMTIIRKENHRPHNSYTMTPVKRNMFTRFNGSIERPSIYIAIVDGKPEELPVRYTYIKDEAVVTYKGENYGIINDMEGGKRKKTRRFKRRRRSYSARLKK